MRPSHQLKRRTQSREMSGVSGAILPPRESLLNRLIRSLLVKVARLLQVGGRGDDDMAVLLRTLEDKGDFAEFVKLARQLDKDSLSWRTLGGKDDFAGLVKLAKYLERHSLSWTALEGKDDVAGLVKLARRLDKHALSWRTFEGEDDFAGLAKLARYLDEQSLSWLDLQKLGAVFIRGLAPAILEILATEPERARAGLRELIAVLSSKQSYHIAPDIYGRNFSLLRDIREDADFKDAADHVIGLGRSLLYYDRLYNLYESVRNVSRLYPTARLNAVEVGAYRGGTSFFLCDLLRTLHASNAQFYCIDTFEGHSAIDLPHGTEGLHSPKAFADTSFEEVSSLLSEFPFAKVIKSRIQECSDKIEPDRFHFVHIDVDIYEPTLFSLNLFLPRMVSGGIVCVDDYNKTSCPGVRQAVEQVLVGSERSIARLYTQTGQCLLVKLGDVEG